MGGLKQARFRFFGLKVEGVSSSFPEGTLSSSGWGTPHLGLDGVPPSGKVSGTSKSIMGWRWGTPPPRKGHGISGSGSIMAW